MLIDETKYLWSKGQPEDVFLSESPFFYVPEQALRIYRFEGTGEISVYSDIEMSDLIFRGALPYELDTPIACDGLTFVAETELTLHFISEVGILKTVLTPFLNTSENMTAISSSYNDDGTFSTEGLSGFMFNGIVAAPLYISSNHWLGFGTSSEQLRILRRDGCSTAIYRQLGETSNGLQFLKIRFEGYTVYSNRVESNRLIFELFLLSNNDMFLNVIQTPTSGNTGTSELICNGTTTALTLFDGIGGGTQVSFYHQDNAGRSWEVVYAMYEQKGSESYGYLLKQGDAFYTLADGELMVCNIESLTAAMFLKYGFEEQSAGKPESVFSLYPARQCGAIPLQNHLHQLKEDARNVKRNNENRADRCQNRADGNRSGTQYGDQCTGEYLQAAGIGEGPKQDVRELCSVLPEAARWFAPV